MPRAHYYASTIRNLKDVAQYAVYPLFKTLAFMAIKDPVKADIVAGVATTGFYASLTSWFNGLESDSFDENARRAVAAELGKRPQDLKFSDYLDSKNEIVKREIDDFRWVNKARYASDLLPMLPTAINFASIAIPGLKNVSPYPTMNRPAPNAPALQHLAHGWRLWDNLIYAGKSGYWFYETFSIPKTGHYEIYKLSENVDEVKRCYSANDLIGVINRSRVDRSLPMVESKTDRAVLWPILEKIAEKMNKAEGFDIPELVYLVGLSKINIYARDAKGNELHDRSGKPVIDPAEVQRSLQEIEHIATVGLDGITKENRAKRKQQGTLQDAENLSFSERVNRKWLDTQFTTYQSLFGLKGKDKHVESISPRDFGEVPNSVA